MKKPKITNAKISSLQKLNLNAAGIDIGSEFHYVAVPEDRDTKSVRKYSCFTPDLRSMSQWLKECKINTVAMESTGVFWIPVYQMLESNGFKVLLVNARHVKNVPGRKTDVCDCRWIQQLHTYGLLRGSFIPEENIRVLRSFLRQRDTLVKNQSSYILRMQKALVQMNIHLHKVISDITGLSGMKIIKSILNGERNPMVLASLKHRRVRKSKECIAKALDGDYREEFLFCLRQEVEAYEFMQSKINECEEEIKKYIMQMNSHKNYKTDNILSDASLDKKNNESDVSKNLKRVCGADLTRIDGLDVTTILTVLSEVGIDMAKWPTEKHFGSWLGLSPNNKITGDSIKSSKTRKVVNRASTAFRIAAWCVGKSETAIGAFYRRLRARIGAPKAITATAYKISRAFYRSLKYGQNYVDIGAKYYEEKYKERVIKNLKKRAAALGLGLIALKNST